MEGLCAGQVLEVRIDAIDLHYDWGYNTLGPLKGALPDDFADNRLIHIPLDRERMTGRLPWGLELPLAPFFGVMAVAPPPAWGALSTLPPRRNGGNLDNKELVAGTTLYLPCFVDGGNFSVGDGHGAQGDGEVCITAIETGLIGRFTLTARADMALDWPMAETPTHLITMAFDPDLDDCVVIALRHMINEITARTGLSREDAYTLCSLAADLRKGGDLPSPRWSTATRGYIACSTRPCSLARSNHDRGSARAGGFSAAITVMQISDQLAVPVMGALGPATAEEGLIQRGRKIAQ